MKKSMLYKSIRNFFVSSNHKIDSSLGFQLTKDDLSDYLRKFLNKEQINSMLNNINSNGYLSNETGMMLKSLIEDRNYDLYIKSIHDSNVNSIFNEGIRCYGETSSIGTVNPTTIDDVNLVNTVEKIYEFPVLISRIKGNNGLSQGFNQINGTLILMIPKNISKDEILYFNEETGTYNIKTDYIIGFLPVDEKGNVNDWILPTSKKNMHFHQKK